jgi:hypothetical protein
LRYRQERSGTTGDAGYSRDQIHPRHSVYAMTDPLLSTLTEDEKRALAAGMETDPQRTAVWTQLWSATRRLGALGLIEWADQRNAAGQTLVALPLHLTPAGVRLARQLRES